MSSKIDSLPYMLEAMLINQDEETKNEVTRILESIDEELAEKKTRFLTG